MGHASASPRYFAFAKFLAQVVTALKYMQAVAMPMATKERTINSKGHPRSTTSSPAPSAPLWYVNAASIYPPPNSTAAAKESGAGPLRSHRYPNRGTARYMASSDAIETMF